MIEELLSMFVLSNFKSIQELFKIYNLKKEKNNFFLIEFFYYAKLRYDHILWIRKSSAIF